MNEIEKQLEETKKKMNKKTILVTLSIFVVLTGLSGCVTGPNTVTGPGGEKVTLNEKGTGPDWCKAGTKITSSGPQGQGSFEIKGITQHNGTEVCEAEYVYDQGSMTQYFNEKGDYAVMVYKDKNGTVVQEINMANPKS